MVDIRCMSIVYQCILSDYILDLFQVKNATFSLYINRTEEASKFEIYSNNDPNDISSFSKTVYCEYENCLFPPEGRQQCAVGQCTCSDECSFLVKSVVENTFSGKAAEMTFQEDQEMSFDIDGSPIPITGYNCYASDCILYPEYVTTSNTTDDVTVALGSPGTDDGLFFSKETILSITILAVIFGFLAFLSCDTYVVMPILNGCRQNREKENMFTQKSAPDDQEESLGGDKEEEDHNYLEFKHLSIDLYENRKKKKTILNNVSGYANAGQILGIMGPSGCGKTTLLNVLVGGCHQKLRQTNGHIQVIGSPTKNKNEAFVAHVPQDDFLYETLTVRESVEYSALLRLPKSLKLSEKQQRVDSIMKELNLDRISNSRVGDRGAGISGGERKRVSIGMELVAIMALQEQNHHAQTVLLMLDEPTSGLDSFAASQLMTILTKLASYKKCIVILSIHQPPMKVFRAMDQILLLSGEGQVVYQGNSSNVKHYFESHGFPCDADNMIPDHMLEVVLDEDKSKVNALVAAAKNNKTEWSSSKPSDGNSKQRIEHQKNRERISIFQEISILYARTVTNLIRNKSLFILQLIISIVVALGVSGLFHNVTDNLAGFQNRSGAFFFTLTFFAFTSFSSMDTFLRERRVFVREGGYQYYRVFSYFIVKTSLDAFFLRVIPVTVYTFILYWIMGLKNTLEAFLIFWTALVIFNVCAGIMTTCISVATSTVGQANLIAAVWFLIMLLFGGFLVNLDSIGPGFAWLKYLSIFYYAFEILITNELSNTLLSFDAPGYTAIPAYGEVFLSVLGANENYQFRNLICLCSLSLGYSLLTYILLFLQVPRTKSRKPTTRVSGKNQYHNHDVDSDLCEFDA